MQGRAADGAQHRQVRRASELCRSGAARAGAVEGRSTELTGQHHGPELRLFCLGSCGRVGASPKAAESACNVRMGGVAMVFRGVMRRFQVALATGCGAALVAALILVG